MNDKIIKEKGASAVSPPLAAILSFIIPGLGQTFSGFIRRGILILLSAGSMTGIMIWRIVDLGYRAGVGWPVFVRAFERRPVFVFIMIFCIAAVWLLSVRDAWICAKERRKPFFGVFLVVLLGFFIQGWQIAEIDPVRFVIEAPEALGPLSRVIWPWKAAITFDERNVAANAQVLDGEGEAPVRAPKIEGRPYLHVEPNVGALTTQDENYKPVPGTKVTLTGTDFEPNTITEIWWIDPVNNKFRPRENKEYLQVTTDSGGAFTMEMTLPYVMVSGDKGTNFIHTIEARQTFKIGGPKASDALKQTLALMVETIFMGMMATMFGIILSIPVSFLAARNIMSGSKVTLAIYYLTRFILNVIRSIEPLIWALIAVVWVGLGPFAGIIALTLHSVAALGKLYSEAIESIDQGPIEAVEATGATRLQVILFGVIPQMISPFISFSIYRWDINVRMSTVIGMVGGGGIGFILMQYIRLLDYRSAGIAVWFIAITVAILDYVSAEIRNRLM